MGGLGGGGDELPSLTPQWMRAGAGGGKGPSLTGGASAGGGGGSHKDAVPQLPPQLVRSGSAERMNGAGPHLGPGGGSSRGNRRHRDHGGRSGRHHGQAQQPQQPHHHPVLNVELNALPATLAPAAPVPASPKPPRSGGGVPLPEPFPRRGSGTAAVAGTGIGSIGGSSGGGGGDHGGGLGNGLSGSAGGGIGGGGGGNGGSPADAADTWGHVSHTTSAGGYSNFDRGRGGGGAAAGTPAGGNRSGGGRGRHGGVLPVSPRRAPKGGGQHRSRGSAKLGASSWGDFDEEERPRPPRLRTASFSPRAGGGDRGGDRGSGDRGGDALGGASLRSALLSPTRRSWRSSGSSDAVWTSRLADTANGRAGQPGSARQADMRRGGSADLGRSHSLPLGGRGVSPRAARTSSGESGGSNADLATPTAAAAAAAVTAAASPETAAAESVRVPQDEATDPAANAPAVGAAAAADADADADTAADAAASAAETGANIAVNVTAPSQDPLLAPQPTAAAANGPAADLLLGLSLRPAALRSGGAPKPYSPAKRAFGGGGGDVASSAQPADAAMIPQSSPLAGPPLGNSAGDGGDSPTAAAAVAEVAQEVKEDAATADAAELLPASSGDLLPAAEEAFLRSLGWTDCTEDSSPGLSDFEIAAFRAQQNGGASLGR